MHASHMGVFTQEQGYKYTLDWCHDDQPTWMKTRSGGRILSIPYSQELNDIPSIVARHDSAKEFADMIIDQFDEMLEQTTRNNHEGPPLVLGIALHPYIVGQPFRLRHLRRALKHIAEARSRHEEYMYGHELDGYPTVGKEYEVWVTTAGAIADHVLTFQKESIAGGSDCDPERMVELEARRTAKAAAEQTTQ